MSTCIYAWSLGERLFWSILVPALANLSQIDAFVASLLSKLTVATLLHTTDGRAFVHSTYARTRTHRYVRAWPARFGLVFSNS